jgi:hypothetical protein
MLGRLSGGSALEREGWVRPGSLNQPLRDAAAKGRVPVQLWRLLVLDHWLERRRQSRSPLPALQQSPAS